MDFYMILGNARQADCFPFFSVLTVILFHYICMVLFVLFIIIMAPKVAGY